MATVHATQEQVMQRTADAAATVSVATAGWSWVTQAHEILQIIATIVAIISGGFAAYYYFTKARAERNR